MNKTINFPILMLGLIGLAIVIYLLLPTQLEQQNATVDAIEITQLETETRSPATYNQDSLSSPLVVDLSNGADSPMEMEKQELEEQYPSEGETMPTPDGGDW